MTPEPQLEAIEYASLDSREKEAYNYQRVAGLLAAYGYQSIKLSNDWNGADFLAQHFKSKITLFVQLKSRITIKSRYQPDPGQPELHIAFPINEDWYLIRHDQLIELVRQNTDWLKSNSWNQDNGAYSAARPSKKLVEALQPWFLGAYARNG